jgi:hypothetical protein
MSRLVLLAALSAAIVPFSSAYGQVLIAHDKFTTAHDFTDGAGFAMSESGSWAGGYNMAVGAPNVFGSSGGVLTIDSTGSSFGWNNTQSDAPFLYMTIPGGSADFPGESFDFRATVKITAQTVANFSSGGLMARVPGATPPGGHPGGNNADEDWFHVGNLRFAGASDTNGSSRSRMRQTTGGQTSTDIPWSNDLLSALPGGYNFQNDGIWLRLERRHNEITGNKEYFNFLSPDGVNFFQQGSAVVPGAGQALNNGSLGIEVGLVLNTFGTANPFLVSFDEFQVEVGEVTQPCVVCTWNATSGDWNSTSNWAGDVTNGTSAVPNGNTITAVFGDGAGGSGTAAVFTNSTVTVKELRLDSSTRNWVLTGPGQINLESNTGIASIVAEQGSHEIQVALSLQDDATMTSTGGSLDVNGPVFLNGNTLTNTSASSIRLNNGVIRPGTLNSSGGSGALVNEGELAGLAMLGGDLSQAESGSLSVVVGDGSAISVDGVASLSGVLDVSLADGFAPVSGQSYTVLTADQVTDLGLSLAGSAANLFTLSVGGGSVTLTAVPEPASTGLAVFAIAASLFGLGRRRTANG